MNDVLLIYVGILMGTWSTVVMAIAAEAWRYRRLEVKKE